MTSSSVWKALDSYANIFQRFDTIPIVWNKEKRLMVFIKNSRELTVFYFSLTFIVGVTNFGTVLFLVLRELFSKQAFLSMLKILLYVTALPLGLFGITMASGVTRYGDQLVKQWNDLVELVLIKGKNILRFL